MFLLFQRGIFRFHVSLRGCTSNAVICEVLNAFSSAGIDLESVEAVPVDPNSSHTLRRDGWGSQRWAWYPQTTILFRGSTKRILLKIFGHFGLRNIFGYFFWIGEIAPFFDY